MNPWIVVCLVPLLVGAGSLTGWSRSHTRPHSEPSTQAPTNKNGELSEKEDVEVVEPLDFEVTVTATRNAVPVDEIGFSIQVIDREEIQAQGAYTLAQVLERVPGFNVVRSGSFGGPTSVFVRGGESDFNLVMVDGVQINQPGGSLDFSNLSTTNVERIEIVRGPGSVLYGSEAVTSIIHIITVQGRNGHEAELQGEGGTFDSYRASGWISGGTEIWGYSLSGLYSETNGFLPVNSGYEQSELSSRFDFQPWAGTAVTATVRHRDSAQQFPTDSTGAAVDPNDFRSGQDTLYTVRFNQMVTSNYTASIQYGHHRRNSSDFTIADGVRDFFDFTLRREDSRSYLDWQNDVVVGSRHLMTLGLSYDREQSISNSRERRSIGFYAQDRFSVNRKLSLSTGLRYDQNDSFRDFVSGNLAASFKLHPYARLRASVGNGFRSPSFDEILGFPSFDILGNQDLSPERNVGMDAGIDLLFPGRPNGLSATLFLNQFSDLIEFTFAVPLGSPNYLNIEKARSKGLELEVFREIRPGFKLGGGYTFTNTKVTDAGSTQEGNFIEGESLLRRPRHWGLVYGSWSGRRLSGQIDFKLKGERADRQFFPDFSSSRVKLPGYLKVDFGLRFSMFNWRADGEVAFTLRGENLLNKGYEEIAGFASPGRRVMAGLMVGF